MIGINAIKITPDILARASRIDEFKGLWTGLERYTTALQLLGDVAAHGVKVQKVLVPLKDQDITPDVIKLLHAVQTGRKDLSGYKQADNQLEIMQDGFLVGRLDTAPPEQVAPLMDKLVTWLNEALKDEDMHPLIAIAVFVAVFLQISPFEDGNLKCVRFLILLLMMKAGYSYAAYVPLDRAMNEHADMIYRALSHNQKSLEAGKPDWSLWLSAFFTVMVDQQKTLAERLDRKNEDLSNLPALSVRVMKLFAEHGRLQMKDIVRLTKGRRSTLKLRLNELVEQGYLRRYGSARSTWYSQI